MRHISERPLSRPISTIKRFGWFRSVRETNVQYVLFSQCQQTGNIFSIERVFDSRYPRANIALSLRSAMKQLRLAMLPVDSIKLH